MRIADWHQYLIPSRLEFEQMRGAHPTDGRTCAAALGAELSIPLIYVKLQVIIAHQ